MWLLLCVVVVVAILSFFFASLWIIIRHEYFNINIPIIMYIGYSTVFFRIILNIHLKRCYRVCNKSNDRFSFAQINTIFAFYWNKSLKIIWLRKIKILITHWVDDSIEIVKMLILTLSESFGKTNRVIIWNEWIDRKFLWDLSFYLIWTD